jgi:hypothetical protein
MVDVLAKSRQLLTPLQLSFSIVTTASGDSALAQLIVPPQDLSPTWKTRSLNAVTFTGGVSPSGIVRAQLSDPVHELLPTIVMPAAKAS